MRRRPLRVFLALLVGAFLAPAAVAQYCYEGRSCYFAGTLGCAEYERASSVPCPVAMPTPTRTPSPIPSPLTLRSVVVNFPDPGHATFWYGGSAIWNGDRHTAWVTVNDAILRYTSPDGQTWNGGERVLEATVQWEDDDQGIDHWDGFQHGVSNACVLSLPCGYVMGYTAGPYKNTEAKGGIGLAYSDDGVIWVKDPRNPIFATPGGETYALSAVTIREANYLYFTAYGGVRGIERGNYRMALDSAGRPFPVPPEKLRYTQPAYPLAWELSGCWMAEDSAWVSAGPGIVTVYRGGDCISTLGTKVGIIDRTISGYAANMLAFAVNRGPDGRSLGMWSFLLYSTGDAWATWHLQAVVLGDVPRARQHLKK